MKIRLIIFVAAIFMAACNLNDSIQYSGDFAVGEVVEGMLEVEAPDTFFFDFEKDTYIYGICNQLSVDVVVTLYDSSGTSIGNFDGPGSGPEMFWFEISDAGRYMLEVAPFKNNTGNYTLELKVVEPVATELEKRADQLFIPYSGDDVPGGVYGVIEGGKLTFSKAYGMANLTHGLPYKVGTPSNIGSVSKQFTAFAILLLEQQGELSLEDDVRKHIPELPDLGEVVRIKNLMNHTNGFREVFNLLPMTGWKGEDVLRREEVIEMLKRQEELQNSPGAVFNYNNSAFIILAEIVERISGQSYPEFMEEQVFGPLGMSSTVVRANPTVIIPGASQGYTGDSTGFHESGDLYSAYGAGGMYTSPADFAKWMSNFHTPLVGNKDMIKRLVSCDTLNNGDTLEYALGIGVNEIRGLSAYSHGGADIAHRAFAVYFPELDAGVLTFSNNAGFESARIAFEIAELYFEDEMELEEGEVAEGADDAEDAAEAEASEGSETEISKEIVVPEEILQTYAGKYLVQGMGWTVEYKVVDGQLKAIFPGQSAVLLTPISMTEFSYEDSPASILFKLNEKDEVTGAVHSRGGGKLELERVPPYEPTMEDLRALEGKYFSKELETFYTLELRDSTLMLLIRNTKEIELHALKDNLYNGNVHFIGEVELLRNESGEVKGLAISNGRTKGIHFERL